MVMAIDKRLTIEGYPDTFASEQILVANREDNYNGHTAITFAVDAILPASVIGSTVTYAENGAVRIRSRIYQAQAQNRPNTTVIQCRDFSSWQSLVLDVIDAVDRDVEALIRVDGFHKTLSQIVQVLGFPYNDEGVEDTTREPVPRAELHHIIISEMREAKDESEIIEVLDKYWLEYYRDDSGAIHITPKLTPENTISLDDNTVFNNIVVTYSNREGGTIFRRQNSSNQDIVDAMLGSVRAKYKIQESDLTDFFPVSTYTDANTITLGEEYNTFKEAFRAVIVESMNNALEQNVVTFTLDGVQWQIPGRGRIAINHPEIPFARMVIKKVVKRDNGANRETVIEAYPELDVAILPVMETALRWGTPVNPTISFRHYQLRSGEVGPTPPILTCEHAQLAWVRPIANNEYYTASLLVQGTGATYSGAYMPPDTVSLIQDELAANTTYTTILRAQNSLTDAGVIPLPAASQFVYTTPNTGPSAPEACYVSNWDRLRRMQGGEYTLEEFDNFPSSVFSPDRTPRFAEVVVGDGIVDVTPEDPEEGVFGVHVESTRNQRGGTLYVNGTYHGAASTIASRYLANKNPSLAVPRPLVNRVVNRLFNDSPTIARGLRRRIVHIIGRNSAGVTAGRPYHIVAHSARILGRRAIRIVSTEGNRANIAENLHLRSRLFLTRPSLILRGGIRLLGWVGTAFTFASFIFGDTGSPYGAVIKFEGSTACVLRTGTEAQLRRGNTKSGDSAAPPTEDSVNWITGSGRDADGWETLNDSFQRSNLPGAPVGVYDQRVSGNTTVVSRFGTAEAESDDDDVFIVRTDRDPGRQNRGFIQMRLRYKYRVEATSAEQESGWLNSPVLDMRNYFTAGTDVDFYP